jgi:Replication-relaxation
MERQLTAITQTDRDILLALSRYHYLTAAQASCLLYPRLVDENRYMQRRLKKLVDGGLVLRLRALPTPHYGQAPHVFTLGGKGRKYLRNFGVSVSGRIRPSEEHQAAQNNPFMYHRLAAIDVLIAADRLCREFGIICPRLLTERDLRRRPLRVSVLSGPPRQVAVIPDGWFQLQQAGHEPISIALELDRSTEDQKAWRQKIAGYAAWAAGPYREAFETDNLTVAVVMPTVTRRDLLRDWTARELSKSAPELLEIFLFTQESPVTTPPHDFFFGNLWYLSHQERPVSLLDLPTRPREVFEHAVVGP